MKIRETLVLKGPFTNTACLNESFQAAQLTATGGLGTSATGQCQGNTFVFTDGNGGVAEKDTKTVTEQVGTSFTYNPQVTFQLVLFDCTIPVLQCLADGGSYPGGLSESFGTPGTTPTPVQAIVHLSVLTTGASYAYLSGHTYF